MSKKCPNCGEQMPEEACFCLNCFSESEGEAFAAELEVEIPFLAEAPKKKKFNLKPAYIRTTATVLAVLMLSLLLAKGVSMIPTMPKNEESGAENGNDAGTSHSEIFSHSDEASGSSEAPSAESENSSDDTAENSVPVYTPPDDGDETIPPNVKPPVYIPPVIPEEPNEEPTDKPIEVPTEKPEEPPKLERDKWEYRADGAEHIEITKYTGNASHVVVPAQIGGKYVVRICKNTIKDNSTVRKITFESDEGQPWLWVENGTFTNLPNLTAVTMPKTDLGIIEKFAFGCPKLEKINIDNLQYRFINGCLYYWSGKEWRLRFICPGAKYDTLTLPTWCAGLEAQCNLSEAVYLKKIIFHKYALMFPSHYNINDTLEWIEVENGNPYAFSENGVLYVRDTNNKDAAESVYPPGKKDKVYKNPAEGSIFPLPDFSNEYIETIYLPVGSCFFFANFIAISKTLPNLKTIYVQEGNAQAEEIRTKFTGEFIYYK